MERLLHIDLARGFTVLIMPAVHVAMLYSGSALYDSLLFFVLRFLAEGPGAPLLMMLMGACFAFNKPLTLRQTLKRSAIFFIAGYGLNFFKFYLPLHLGVLPSTLQQEIEFASIDWLLFGDILHLVAISYPVLCFFHRIQNSILCLCMAIGIMILAPWIWDLQTGYSLPDYLLSLFTGHPPYTWFPVFPWLTYPLIGLGLRRFICEAKTGRIGFACIIISLSMPATTRITLYPSHYRTEAADTLFNIGIVLIWLSFFRYLSRRRVFRITSPLLEFCSRHITSYYLIQWVLVCWCLPLAGYHQQSLAGTLTCMCILTIITLIFTKLLTYAKQTLRHSRYRNRTL